MIISIFITLVNPNILWRDYVNGMDDNQLEEIARNEKSNTLRPERGRTPKHWRESWISTSWKNRHIG